MGELLVFVRQMISFQGVKTVKHRSPSVSSPFISLTVKSALSDRVYHHHLTKPSTSTIHYWLQPTKTMVFSPPTLRPPSSRHTQWRTVRSGSEWRSHSYWHFFRFPVLKVLAQLAEVFIEASRMLSLCMSVWMLTRLAQNRNRCVQKLVILHLQTYERTPIAHQKQISVTYTSRVKITAEEKWPWIGMLQPVEHRSPWGCSLF